MRILRWFPADDFCIVGCLREFRAAALSHLAAQHDELISLRRELAKAVAGNVRGLTSRQQRRDTKVLIEQRLAPRDDQSTETATVLDNASRAGGHWNYLAAPRERPNARPVRAQGPISTLEVSPVQSDATPSVASKGHSTGSNRIRRRQDSGLQLCQVDTASTRGQRMVCGCPGSVVASRMACWSRA